MTASRSDAEHQEDAFYSALLDDDAQELYDNAPCGYLSLLPDGTIVKANRTFLSWTGFDRAEIVGRRRLPDLLGPGDRIFYETHVAPLLRMQGRAREIAVEVVVRDGTRLPVIANVEARRDDAGRVTLIRAALFDATERRAYERELVDQRKRAEVSEGHARALARTLEASLFPAKVPTLDGLDVGAAYHPGSDVSIVGGDFYDVFDQPDGSVVVAIGDVVGKGPRAAALTSLARHTIRAAALRSSAPGDILRTVATAFHRYQPDDYCTVGLLVIDPPPRALARFATGGHPLPLKRSRRGAIETVGRPGQILGLLSAPAVSEEIVELLPGDYVLMYTDGVVDARRDAEVYGEDRLVALFAGSTPRTAQELADAVGRSALTFRGSAPGDDIAVVALKAVAPEQRRRSMANDRLARARRRTEE